MTAIENLTEVPSELPARTQLPSIQKNGKLLAALAGHELREPVQAIQSFLSVVLDGRTGPLTELQMDFLSTANQAAKRLSQRIADVQLALNYEDNPFQINRVPVNLRDSVERCCREMSLLARCHHVTLQLDHNGWREHGAICGDPDRVDQVLLNLIENGIRYAKPSTIVHVAVRRSESGGGAVVVRNEVESPPKEDPETWFEPFERGANSADPDKSGLGLGLTVVSYLMQAHQGNVTARVDGNKVSVGVIFPGAHNAAQPHATPRPQSTRRPARPILSTTLIPVVHSRVRMNGSSSHDE